jgi:hypothetical protein
MNLALPYWKKRIKPMAFYKDERLALFIDGTNLYSAARSVGLEIDFRKLLKEFQSRGRLVRASYYTALVESDEYSPIRPLVDWLAYNGFNVVKKPAREFVDREGRKRVRGNMDVELAVDMLEAAAYCDHIVLFSGNGDFRRLVEAVKAFAPYAELLPRHNGNVRAKTGTLTGVSCYAGFVRRQGRWEPFSLLINQAVPYNLRLQVADALAAAPDLDRLCPGADC